MMQTNKCDLNKVVSIDKYLCIICVGKSPVNYRLAILLSGRAEFQILRLDVGKMCF